MRERSRFRGRDLPAQWRSISKAIARELDMLDAALTLVTLRSPPGNRLEALKGDRRDNLTARVNRQWRMCLSGPRRVPIGSNIVDCR